MTIDSDLKLGKVNKLKVAQYLKQVCLPAVTLNQICWSRLSVIEDMIVLMIK